MAIYTRAYAGRSPGREPRQLIAGRGAQGAPLSHKQLLAEFSNHAYKENREPTALISVSNRIVDTVDRAFALYAQHGKASNGVWVAFIEVQDTDASVRVHSAEALATTCSWKKPKKFRYEYLFEWVIPEECVIHQVSLQTLIARGLEQMVPRIVLERETKTRELRKHFAEQFEYSLDHDYGFRIGIDAGDFAKCFGLRAPVDWIAHRLFEDCVKTPVGNPYKGWTNLNFARGEWKQREERKTREVTFDFFWNFEEGIRTVLDWWPADLQSYGGLGEFDIYRDVMEAKIISDYIDADEKKHDNEAIVMMLERHDKIWEEIEARAVELGL